jgi:hypothetical protein
VSGQAGIAQQYWATLRTFNAKHMLQKGGGDHTSRPQRVSY